MESSIQCVIFDMDGCLVNSERIYIEGWMNAFQSKKIPITQEIVEGWAGHGLTWINEQVEQYTHNHLLTLELRQLREEYFYQQLFLGNVNLMPYAHELLSYLKENKVLIGLATCTLESKASEILKYHKLEDFFDFTVFGNEVSNFKPSPDIYLKALEKSGVDVNHCIVFEDSPTGVMSAHQAGLKVIYIPDLAKNKVAANVLYDVRIESFNEGIELLKDKIYV